MPCVSLTSHILQWTLVVSATLYILLTQLCTPVFMIPYKFKCSAMPIWHWLQCQYDTLARMIRQQSSNNINFVCTLYVIILALALRPVPLGLIANI